MNCANDKFFNDLIDFIVQYPIPSSSSCNDLGIFIQDRLKDYPMDEIFIDQLFIMLFMKIPGQYKCLAKRKISLQKTQEKYIKIIISHLIESGLVDVHYHNDDLLRRAYINGYSLVAQYLLQQGADFTKFILDDTIPIGQTLIQGRCLNELRQIAEAGIDLCFDDLLLSAIENRNEEIAYFFMEEIGCEISLGAFIKAVDLNLINITKKMVALGASYHKQYSHIILSAIYNGDSEIIIFLLENGAILKIPESKHETNITKICQTLRKYQIDDADIINLLAMSEDDIDFNN